MDRVKVYFPSSSQGPQLPTSRDRVFPAGVAGSTKAKYLCQAVDLGGNPIDITGWTIGGAVRRRKTESSVAITGTLEIDADNDLSAIGYFEWTPAAADMPAADIVPGYLVQFVLTDTTDIVSLPMRWSVYANVVP